jgi:hypothetical protein
MVTGAPLDDFGYQMETFSKARGVLMAPHPKGEAESFMHAFNECGHGLRDLETKHPSDDGLNDNVRGWLKIVRRIMDTSQIQPDSVKGTHLQKAEQLTIDEKFEFSHTLDELASWFAMTFWTKHAGS